MKWKFPTQFQTTINMNMTPKPMYASAVIIGLTCLQLISVPASGQPIERLQSDAIAIVARPSQDSITLRWAPLSPKIWMLGNVKGYRVERFLVSRDGKLLSQPEKIVLEPSLRPWPEERWERLVNNH